ncbi:MAG: UDP-N-acetylglucosamine--N-acetylmuramyl-(pentapeptide) pyrophosphoryl-undecaprenol N-acetylglucosamine transferase [Oscillospiraceae bacterium]|nr:UDP-N-acetylglucosamine--N-acetylmuramyl-(pentapeptide) pyrophosphoryl-undecaprenol N-acetylglucosamine transferase [Oscillospiraceae bacterium]
MRFLVVAAGTAGHINPALAIASELRSIVPEAEFLFVGAGREMEKRLIPEEGFELKNLRVTGLARGFSGADIRHNIETLNNLVAANAAAKKVVEEFRPDVVIGTGGYVCYPVIRAAARRKIPTVLHESNAAPGMANKLLSGTVTKMLVSFPNTEKRYYKPERVVYTGTPMRGDFTAMTRQEARRRLKLPDGVPLAVSFWGSLGARDMNRRMADFIKLNEENSASFPIRHIHATGGGEEGFAYMQGFLKEAGVGELCATDLRPYINDMGTVMTAADLVICRSGASTLAELTGLGRASILVPSPNVTANHQEKNAMALQNGGCAVMIKESQATGAGIYEAARQILSDTQRRSEMESNARKMGVPDARRKIAELILGLL